MRNPRAMAGLLCVLMIVTPCLARRVPPDQQTALDRYVAAPDPAFHFEVNHVLDGKGYRAFFIDLTSQTWLTEREVDRPVWKHSLIVIKPSQVRGSTGAHAKAERFENSRKRRFPLRSREP